MVVVLPAPLRPRRPVMVPLRTEKETPSTARTAPNNLVISRTERTSVISRFSTESAAYCTLRRELCYFGGWISYKSKTWMICLKNRLIVCSISPNGESSRRGAANAGAVAINVTTTSVPILTHPQRPTHPPYGSRERALLLGLEGALSLGVTGKDISLPQK